MSYRVKALHPLELERIGIPTGSVNNVLPLESRNFTYIKAGKKCGSTYIDLAFKQWLLQLLGQKRFKEIDPDFDGKISSHTTEGEAMRELMTAFTLRKESFTKHSGNMSVDLPVPLDALNLDTRIIGGRVTITKQVFYSDETVLLLMRHQRSHGEILRYLRCGDCQGN